VPGKPGTFGSFDSPVVNGQQGSRTVPTAPVVADSNTLSVKEQKQQKRLKVLQDKQLADYIPGGAAGAVPSKKQLKAAMQLKRQQQQQQQQQGSVGTVTGALSSTTASATTVASAGGGKNTATAVAAGAGTPAAGAASSALKSTYSTPTIEKAMEAYHAQATRDLSAVVPYIPTYTAASAAQ
jgi:ABC-type oligopeptide transport system substrate-binding subunit